MGKESQTYTTNYSPWPQDVGGLLTPWHDNTILIYEQ
jgi:hypothetical protein